MDAAAKYFSLSDSGKLDFLIQLEFDGTAEKWDLLQSIIRSGQEYDLARIQTLKIFEIAAIPKCHKDIFAEMLCDIIASEEDCLVRNYAASAAINFIEYCEIEKIIAEKVVDRAEDIDVRYNLLAALLKMSNENLQKELLTELLSDSSLGKAAARNLCLYAGR
jgi:hypothetical protein